VHKANIMKKVREPGQGEPAVAPACARPSPHPAPAPASSLHPLHQADGIFLESCQEVSKQYPQVEYEEVIVDNCMMQLVQRPQQFDVMVTPNFYGSLVTNAAAGLIGGPGICPGANIGSSGAMFEQGARHVGMDIKGQDAANPTGILLASVQMLRYLKLPGFADRMEKSIFSTCVRVGRARGRLEGQRTGGAQCLSKLTPPTPPTPLPPTASQAASRRVTLAGRRRRHRCWMRFARGWSESQTRRASPRRGAARPSSWVHK